MLAVPEQDSADPQSLSEAHSIGDSVQKVFPPQKFERHCESFWQFPFGVHVRFTAVQVNPSAQGLVGPQKTGTHAPGAGGGEHVAV